MLDGRLQSGYAVVITSALFYQNTSSNTSENNQFDSADDKLRTALIYVMNDAVQKSSKKGNGETVTMAFHPHVINAIGMARYVPIFT